MFEGLKFLEKQGTVHLYFALPFSCFNVIKLHFLWRKPSHSSYEL